MVAHTAAPQGDNETLIVIPALGKRMVVKCKYVDYIKGYQRYKEGRLIQDAFPTLQPDEREFLQSGITPDEWKELFGQEEDF